MVADQRVYTIHPRAGAAHASDPAVGVARAGAAHASDPAVGVGVGVGVARAGHPGAGHPGADHPGAGQPGGALDVELLAAVLNASFTAFALESLGRASMGEGALEWTVADAASLPVLDPRRLAPAQAAAARAALLALAGRAIRDVAGERDAPDRRRLDRAVAAAVPGLADMLDVVWEGLIASVTHRNARARRGAPGPRATPAPGRGRRRA
jgi:hypothetical protein